MLPERLKESYLMTELIFRCRVLQHRLGTLIDSPIGRSTSSYCVFLRGNFVFTQASISQLSNHVYSKK